MLHFQGRSNKNPRARMLHFQGGGANKTPRARMLHFQGVSNKNPHSLVDNFLRVIDVFYIWERGGEEFDSYDPI